MLSPCAACNIHTQFLLRASPAGYPMPKPALTQSFGFTCNRDSKSRAPGECRRPRFLVQDVRFRKPVSYQLRSHRCQRMTFTAADCASD